MIDEKTKASVWFTICNFIVKAISFITIPIFTRMMSPIEYGRMSVYYSYEQFFLILATMELSLGAYQRGILRYKNNLALFTSSLLSLSNIITLLISLGLYIRIKTLANFMQVSVDVFILMTVYFFFQPSYATWQNRQRFSYRYKPVVISTILFTLLTVLGPMAGLIIFGPYANVKIGTMLVFEILFCIPFCIKQINIPLMIRNSDKVLEMWRFSFMFQWPLVLHSFSYLVLGQSDRVMIQKMVGDSEAGIYSIAYTFANALLIFQTSINQVYKPWRYQILESKQYKSLAEKTNFHLLLFFVITTTFLLIVPDIFYLIMPKYYYQCIWIIPPIAVGIYFMFLYTVFTDVESYYGATKAIMFVSLICAILNILGNYIGISTFGFQSCAYVTMVCYTIFSILHYIFMIRVLKEECINQRLFNFKKIFLLSTAMIGMVPVTLLLYSNGFIRYVVILIIAVIVIININEILKYKRRIQN